jgi:hypothetical protein
VQGEKMSFLANSSSVIMAYLDPGSGSFIIQLLLAGGLGAAFLIKTYWRKIKSLFNKNKDEEPQPVVDEHIQEQ